MTIEAHKKVVKDVKPQQVKSQTKEEIKEARKKSDALEEEKHPPEEEKKENGHSSFANFID